LCHLLSNCVTDLVVSLSMFEQAYTAQIQTPSGFDQEEWQRDADRHRQREAELEAEQGVSWGQPDHFERHQAIMEQARRDVLREKWVEQGGPEAYRRRVVFIHARSFVTTLALLIHAPQGGAMVVDALNNQHFGGTVADGTYAEVEVADATTEIARAAVQAVYDALPWQSGHRLYEPTQ
jgi:hypothetical protein